MKKKIGLVMLLIPILAFSQGKMDRLLVYGKGFMFGVKEPAGWTGDTQNAGEIGANILFFKNGESFEHFKSFIYVKIMTKTDENIESDMEYDVKQYTKSFPKMKFKEIELANSGSRVVAKLFELKGKRHEYVAYINPGKGQPWMFSAGMNTGKDKATDAEFAAYRKVVSSLMLVTKNNVTKK